MVATAPLLYQSQTNSGSKNFQTTNNMNTTKKSSFYCDIKKIRQNLLNNFVKSAEEALAFFDGSLQEKMKAWCFMVFMTSFQNEKISESRIQTLSQAKAILLLADIKLWLINNHSASILLPNDVDVYLGEDYIRITVNQKEQIEINVITHNIVTTRLAFPPTYISLYKYITWEVLDKILENGMMAASQPSKCNDVYEFMPKWKNESEQQYILNIVKESEMVIICLSRTPSSSVMWGHYADNGKGVLLRFQLPIYRIVAGTNGNECLLVIARDENELNNLNESSIYIAQVHYTEERPDLNPKKDFFNYARLFSSKGSDWSYEKEIRIIFNNDEFGTRAINDLFLTPVIMPYLTDIVLGPRNPHTHDEVKENLKRSPLASNNISVHSCTYNSDSYKLNISMEETPEIEKIPLYRLLQLSNPYKVSAGKQA